MKYLLIIVMLLITACTNIVSSDSDYVSGHEANQIISSRVAGFYNQQLENLEEPVMVIFYVDKISVVDILEVEVMWFNLTE